MSGTFGQSLSRDDRLRVGSFGERYGGVAEGGVGSTRNSSSIWMMILGTASVIATNNPRLILAHLPLERPRHSNLQTSMRYFFYVFDGPKVFPDEVGNTLSSPEVAISQAKVIAAELCKAGELCCSNLVFVLDENGRNNLSVSGYVIRAAQRHFNGTSRRFQ
jgi:hypothetical protein